jgi:FtsP/CotA-like multicopper oxidase with cupredoxin domain
MKRLLFLSFFASLTVAHAEPLVTSWLTNISSKYARIYSSTANRTAGTSATTWSGTQSQTTPAYAGVNEINSSTNWVYVRSTGLGGHVMGPWNNPNLPKNQSILWRFPRTPTIPTTKTLTGMGSIGFMVDGVAAYNTSDGFSYSNTNAVDGTPNGSVGAGDGIWNRDALPNESVSFDNALAHNQPSGEYHYHANAISTRYLAGDNIVYDSAAKTYAENTSTTNFQHSPIIGWMKDGLPLYGPYGYDGGSTGATATATLSGSTVSTVSVTAGGTLYQSVPLVTFSGGGGSGATATAVVTAGVVTSVTVTNGGSGYTSAPTVKIGGVRRMISGYQLRDGTNNTTNLASTGRKTLPAWALAAQNRAQLSSSTQYGPATTYTTTGLTYTLGHYAEDYDYLGDLGFTQSSRTNAGGVFFDLNKYNVRFCVTPEYPNGTWAYFATIKADGTSFYPYIVGRWYYGDPSIGGGSTTATVMNADTPLTQQFIGGANSAITVNTPTVSSGSVSLTWSSVEGGTYSVDASTNQSTWTSEKTALTPTNVPTAPTVGNSTVTTNTSYTTLGSSGTEYARVNRTALATYDSAGQTASTIAQSTITPYSASGIPNTVPTITAISAQSTNQNTATSAIPFTVGDAETAVASLTLSGSSSNTTLVPNTNIVFGGSGASRTVTVSPATNQTGSATITVGVNDGLATTTTTFTLTVTASTPTITNVIQTPSAPTSANVVAVKANVAAPSGRTLSSVQLTYDTGAGGSSTVFTETMGTAAGTAWTGTGVVNPWTIAFAGPPASPFSQTSAANHTSVGQGNQFGMEINASAPVIANSTMTTTNSINATGSTGTVEFYMMAANLSGVMGWDFQTSTDGTTYNTRLSELTGSNHTYQLYTYTLTAAERVSTLKLRFRFVGSGGPPSGTSSKISLDDIKVTVGSVSSPVTVTMFDDGAHGDGSASDGVYGASIPAQVNNTTVTYSIAATDSSTASASTTNSSYTVGVAPATMTVTPSSGLTSSGTAGGPFTPSTASYTITNTGSTSMNWTATKTASWLTLDSTSGTLAASATATVNATINSTANSLSAGSFNDTITFANTTNGNGNTTRAVALSVSAPSLPAAPVLIALPTYSSGTAKTISWTAVSGATSYTLQVASSADFSTSLLSSQTVTSPTGSFSALIAGTTYYYRVLATNSVGSSTYSNTVSSTQDAVGPTVAITSPSSAQSTATNTITVSGTSSDTQSGIAKVTVNGVTATTSNSFATWSISVPLGFGTNGITAVAYDGAGNTTTTAPVNVTLTAAQTYNPLIIPEVMTGTTFNLNLHKTTKQFLTGAVTNTYAYNNMLFWGPTLIMNKGDWVQMNVANNLDDTTTTHWHGFHIPAIMDGGPHQTIPPGTTWSPSFKVDNNAATYWYHPHLHATVQEQLTKGGGGFIIIRDPTESALNLPRTYGVDDFPLAMTSRRWASNQLVTSNIAYGDYMLVNGTLSPQVTLPKQYVRLRLLNAEIERSYNLGFSDGRTFYQIATDGGLVNAPVALTRLVLAVGERAEILVDLTGDTVGSTLDLQAFNSGQSNDFPGGEAATAGQFGSLLNNTTINILHINVGATTANAVTTRPATLTTNTFWTDANVTNTRTVTITGGIPNSATPLFTFDSTSFSPTVFNQRLNLNAVEKWTITNSSGFSHSFHIHDIQFNLMTRTNGNNAGIKAYEGGWKDVFFIGQNQTVTFIAKFDGFASNTNPFMYHCHFSNHEDEGLMGQFIVQNNTVEDLAIASFTRTGASDNIVLNFKATPGTTYTLQYSPDMTTSSWTDIGSVTSDGTSANFTETNTTRLGQARGFYRVKIPVIP